jgi:glycolate oxidase iron-sulfur subunit
MQTQLADFIRDTPQGAEADAILRTCVHCGFCLATCPTYPLLGDELDSPRGRIYLMKQMLEGAPVTQRTLLHLDRCLTCRACETTCPSGVQYGRLVDIGRDIAEKKVRREPLDSAKRAALRKLIPTRALFSTLLALGRIARPMLPAVLRSKIPIGRTRGAWPATRHPRTMIVLDGCVQPALAPDINSAAARVLDAIGISLIRAPGEGCCGAVPFHLNAQEEALGYARRNIDAWWPHIETGAEAVVITASGCGTLVVDYGHLLAEDPAYAPKAARVSELARDVSQIVADERERLRGVLRPLSDTEEATRVAFHSPCSLQHGLKLKDVVEPLLRDAGYVLTHVPDAHLCCGSAGTYSLLHPALSQPLLRNKVVALESDGPAVMATANIGCLQHIQSGTATPVRHWIELLADRLV